MTGPRVETALAESWTDRLWRLATTGGVPRRSFYVAIVVGLILNAINQGDRIVAGVSPQWLKLALTFVVPYCVATYGAVSARWNTGL
ncbi:MAG: nitrate/nitrite transporter NrtS [Proteobacteria bacterium]|nr:nitrate/nitrite transporter NrtS [Pseudomonadota bacterium]